MDNTFEDRIKARIIDLFLGGDVCFPLDFETNLIAGGICDSLGLVQLVAALETEFPGLRIQDQDITHESMGSITAIANLIRQSADPL